MRIREFAILAVGLFLSASTARLATADGNTLGKGALLLANHPIVGSWFGRAVPVNPFCQPGTEDCPIPPEVIMTPAFWPDSSFQGNDTLTFLAPHTTAVGQWVPRGWNGAEVNYMFMTSADSKLTGALRFRFIVEDIRTGVATGTTTAFFYPFADENGLAILDDEGFPTPNPVEGALPAECLPGVNHCLAVFRFEVRKIERAPGSVWDTLSSPYDR